MNTIWTIFCSDVTVMMSRAWRHSQHTCTHAVTPLYTRHHGNGYHDNGYHDNGYRSNHATCVPTSLILSMSAPTESSSCMMRRWPIWEAIHRDVASSCGFTTHVISRICNVPRATSRLRCHTRGVPSRSRRAPSEPRSTAEWRRPGGRS